ncbi:MAG: NAD/NADP octopine/nopaline dehydrogenase family protein [Synergistales bacterium]|nr:NAD/NADP octopine/nopaline dehydrogenase family protein [Synergistales bacterium]
MSPTIAVIGAGNGGQALAGHIACNGFPVRLLEHPDFEEKVRAIHSRGGVELKGALEAFGKIQCVTTSPSEALDGADVVILVAPSFAQRPMMRMARPYLENVETVLFIPGNFGTLEMALWVEEEGQINRPTLAETNTLPYACRQVEPGVVDIWGVKTDVTIGVFPSQKSSEVIEAVKEFFPIPLIGAQNVLETSFSNLNMIVHCPTMIMNAARIESPQDSFRFYTDGMSPSVCKVVEAMDGERLAIGSTLGLSLESELEWMKRTYRLQGETLYDALQNNRVYSQHGADAPGTLSHRYLTEDVPYLLVPVASFGAKAGVPCPHIESIITLAGTVNATDFRRQGRTLSSIGADFSDAEGLLHYIKTGTVG